MDRLDEFGNSYLKLARSYGHTVLAEFIEKNGGTLNPIFSISTTYQRQTLANIHEIKGSFKRNEKTHLLEGADAIEIYSFFAITLKELNNHRNIWNVFDSIPADARISFKRLLLEFSQAVERAITTQSATEMLKEIQKGNPVILEVILQLDNETITHSVPILFFSGFLFLCNRGIGLEKTGKSLCMSLPNQSDILQQFIEALQFRHKKLSIDEFAQMLHKLSEMQKNQDQKPEFRRLIEQFNSLSDLPVQIVGNCVYANLEGLFFDFLLRINDLNLNGNNVEKLTEDNIREIKTRTHQQFTAFKTFLSNYSISELVDEQEWKSLLSNSIDAFPISEVVDVGQEYKTALLKTIDPVERKMLIEQYLRQETFTLETPTSSIAIDSRPQNK